MRTATGARRPPRVPEWLAEVARPGGGPVPWAQMGHAVLAIAVPVAVGLAAGHLVAGVVAGLGELIATMADRAGPYLVRVRRVAVAAIFGGAAGLLIGTAVNGRGWVTVPVMIAVAGVSALLSSVGTGLDSATATEVLAAIRPRLPRAVLILATHELPARPDVLGPAWTRVPLD